MTDQIDSTALVALTDQPFDAATMFVADTVDSTLDLIEEKAMDFVADVSTKKGRDAIRTRANMVPKIKTIWVTAGKDINRAERVSIDARNKECNKIEERLGEIKVKVREKLTNYEAAQKKIEADQKEIIRLLISYYNTPADSAIEYLEKCIADIKLVEIDGDILSDCYIRATQSKESSLASLEKKLADRIQHDKDQAELTELREKNAKQEEENAKREAAEAESRAEEKEKKERHEREEKIRKDAEAKAKKEAAEKLAKEREAKQKAIQDRKDAEARAEREKKEAVEKAKLEAEEAVEEAERKAAEEAEAKERGRLAKEKSEREGAEKKAANKKHRAKIKEEACCFIGGAFGLPSDQVEDIFDSISAGEVPHITVNY